jgi:hypothetical protein
MKTTDILETIATDKLNIATGGAICHRESMGYINPPGTCPDFWSSAPTSGQNGFGMTDAERKAAIEKAKAAQDKPTR